MAKKRVQYDIPADNVITIRNVYKAYDKQTPALNGLSLDIKQGEFVFIVGDSGSGKSTLIKLLLKELTPTRGFINVLGYDLNALPHRKIAKFRRNLGIVFQDFRLLKDRNIYENVAFAQRIIQVPNYRIKTAVPNILATVGLANKYKNYPDQLSGGEQQRVALARALINKPFILLADEPTGNLDPRNSWEIMKLLEKVNDDGMTVVVVTHNREIVNAMHKRVITMKQGVIMSDEKHGSYTRSENEAYEEEVYQENDYAVGEYTEETVRDNYPEEDDDPYRDDYRDDYQDDYRDDYREDNRGSRGEKRSRRRDDRYQENAGDIYDDNTSGDYTGDLTGDLSLTQDILNTTSFPSDYNGGF